MKTCEGYECFGKFFIGDDRKIATTLFKQLKGSDDADERTVLTMELMETFNDLPLNLHIITCTLEQLAANTSIITKELFRSHNIHKPG
jgi:hypothetical protein